MAEITWIKLTTNIFEDEKINFIESLPDSDMLIVIWLKLLTMAGKINDGGFIYLTEKMPYTPEMLANKLKRPLNTIKLALKTFQELEMIEIIGNKIFISKWEKHQAIDEMAKIKAQTRERVARHREIKRLEMNSLTCQYCGGIATGYDHIVATARGGSDDISNKVECCIECNRIKNDKPLIDFLNNNRNRINNEIIKNNDKLKRLVTLCNVTDRYTVTHCNGIDIEEIKKENKKRNIFSVPSVDEIKEYCQQRQNKINANSFYDYYQSKGWMIGKNKMKDWQACIRTWEHKDKKEVSPYTREEIPYNAFN